MAGIRMIAKGGKFWPSDAGVMSPQKIVEMYELGFAGAWYDPQAVFELRDAVTAAGGFAFGADAASAFGLTESGAGKLSLPFLEVLKLYPNAFPGAAQERGDCVSHDTKNALLTSMCTEITSGTPDPVSGKLEEKPEVPAAGEKEGVLSTELIYWYRGYNGDGWSCATAAKVAMTKGGCVVRKPYPELGIDLTNYSGSLAGKYGARAPGPEIQEMGKLHLARTVTELGGAEELRDFIANGYGISSCGGEGFSSSRDANGVSRRSGRWSHAFAYIGFDDRDVIKQAYNEPLVLCMNSWGVWNSGPRTILGTNIQIPEGAFWARWSDVRARYMAAISNVNGWPRRQLPDYGKLPWG